MSKTTKKDAAVNERGAGRAKKDPRDRKDARLEIRLTSKEYALIRRKSAPGTMSDYLRGLVLRAVRSDG